jgi:hypothetical protein
MGRESDEALTRIYDERMKKAVDFVQQTSLREFIDPRKATAGKIFLFFQDGAERTLTCSPMSTDEYVDSARMASTTAALLMRRRKGCAISHTSESL